VTRSIVEHADDAYEAIRAINHKTITTAHPAPVVYAVLGNLAALGLDQALYQLGVGLVRSLDLYKVRQDDGTDPAVAVDSAVTLLEEARGHAVAMCRLLGLAQTAINRQGYDELDDDEVNL
jgi:hypothetical protein